MSDEKTTGNAHKEIPFEKFGIPLLLCTASPVNEVFVSTLADSTPDVRKAARLKLASLLGELGFSSAVSDNLVALSAALLNAEDPKMVKWKKGLSAALPLLHEIFKEHILVYGPAPCPGDKQSQAMVAALKHLDAVRELTR